MQVVKKVLQDFHSFVFYSHHQAEAPGLTQFALAIAQEVLLLGLAWVSEAKFDVDPRNFDEEANDVQVAVLDSH